MTTFFSAPLQPRFQASRQRRLPNWLGGLDGTRIGGGIRIADGIAFGIDFWPASIRIPTGPPGCGLVLPRFCCCGPRFLFFTTSVLLAWLRDEPGNAPVIDALSKTALVSAVNRAEPLSKLADLGVDPSDATAQVQLQAVLGTLLQVRSLDDAQALETVRLRAATRSAGLSLTDRARLALARTLGVPALTTDRMWNALDLSIEVRIIR